ncbi:hypothetical protein MLD38_011259 [Melastoma candidum]|uniref:Uncharacterized protein n=1 Tax=Melastoma candidum TaxID=119954 RepID=A0ACB9R1Y0_9MYRT|nr:hypothetical protein MLD38_011259 [Melastoma candidum]
MRTGICMIQKAMTPESAAVLKQSATLARRRGHTQVTPLHVASTMLASPTGLLRTSCLNSHSHPLQCKALELCFNVALNRLPSAASSGPILGGPCLLASHPPALSNALVAAFKRAQAHQRRGSVESQQQPILALKIELEQLVISILDDPSVSRVMREAGFSSSHVKSRVEQTVSIEVSSQEPVRPKNTTVESPRLAGTKPNEEVSSVDAVGSILDSMLGKKRNTVVIGESLASAESMVKAAINKLESKSSSVQVISFPVLSTRNLSRDETEHKLAEIRTIITRSCYIRTAIVLYLGDIEGVSELWMNHIENQRGHCFFSSLENVVMEIKKWCCGLHETKRVSILGVATPDSYKKCEFGQPSLETVWELHPHTVPPSQTLTLSLNLNSVVQPEARTNPKRSGARWTLFGYSGEETDRQSMTSFRTGSEKLPPWLQQYKVEKTLDPFHSQGDVSMKNLRKKWSSFCDAFHNNNNNKPEKLLKFSSTPCSPATSSPSSNFTHAHLTRPRLVKEEVHVDDNGSDGRPELLINPTSSPNSASSSEIMEDPVGYSPAFNELTVENTKILTDALEAKVPWQRDVIPEMVDTILSCRSRKSNEATWIAILGPDSIGKEKFARELGKLVHGSHACFASLTTANIVTESSRKRAREEIVRGRYLRIFGEAVNENPHRVFFLEGFDGSDDEISNAGIRKAIRSGKLTVGDGQSVSLRDAIVVITYRASDARPLPKRLRYEEEGEVREEDNEADSNHDMLDLNVAIEDDDEVEGDVLDLVDGKFVFNIQEV